MLSVATAILVGVLPIATGASDPCSDGLAWFAGCTVSNMGSEIEIGASRVDLGGEGSERAPRSRSDSSINGTAEQDCGPLNRCDNFTVSLLPQATIADVASFAPTPAALGGEPAGHGIVGLPTNFLVTAAEHTETGTLFDLPVTVRFVPERVVLSPGDGTSIQARSPGRAWSALDQAPFSPTDTSHTYTARGTYTATAVVQYHADVDFGRGWRPVTGTLDIPTSRYTVEVLEVHSALVERTCHENPNGPGC